MIPEDEYRSMDATAMAELVRAGEVSADELAEACAAAIDRWDPLLGAVADRTETNGAIPAGSTHPADPAAPFAGVPMAVKELLAVPGLPWTMGSRLMAHNPAGPPSPYVERLLATGARVVCSATSSEFGLVGSTESLLRGTTTNPWGPGLSAGGSSGGSAALVAAGIVPFAHANDAGGSIRYPASMTGTFGFKPSAGRTAPNIPGATGLAALVADHVITRSVRDSATFLTATEAAPTDRPADAPRPGPGAPLRIATLTTTLKGGTANDEVLAAVERTRHLLAELGHDLVDVDAPEVDGEALSEAFFTTAAASMREVADLLTPMLARPPGPDELEPFTLELIEWAATLPDDQAARNERAFAAANAAYLATFESCDAVLSPTVTRPVWPVGMLAPTLDRATLIERTGELVAYTPIHNTTGCPAMSVPLEQDHRGLPIGMHLAGPPQSDRMLLALARSLEQARPWAHRRPDLDALAAASTASTGTGTGTGTGS